MLKIYQVEFVCLKNMIKCLVFNFQRMHDLDNFILKTI